MHDNAEVLALPYLRADHFHELTIGSGIDPDIARLNHESISGDTVYELLLTAIDRSKLYTNAGFLRSSYRKRYETVARGAWVGRGARISDTNEPFFCIKPDHPRIVEDNGKRRTVKYEHPPERAVGVFAPKISVKIWKRIVTVHGLELPFDLDTRSDEEEAHEFWRWVIDNVSVPLAITEGIKKAEALLTIGYPAIALPGITSGYRTVYDAEGNKKGRKLINELALFASRDREIVIAFDQDVKPKTVKAVSIATTRLGTLLERRGASASVMRWSSEWKGVDDFIVGAGASAFHRLFREAYPLDLFETLRRTQLTYSANQHVNQRYLEKLEIPTTAKLVAIKSPKGTGKTEALARYFRDRSRKALALSFRQHLSEEIGSRLGIGSIYHPQADSLGTAACIDSLTDRSRLQFQLHDWSGADVILDEIEQLLWHLLNASTEVARRRQEILHNFQALLRHVIDTGGRIWALDADLSDRSLDLILSLIDDPELTPYVIVNDWRPLVGWQVVSYPTPPKLFLALAQHIRQGGKPLIVTFGQKLETTWGTHNLVAQLEELFPEKEILQIDSQTTKDPDHPAFHCIPRLNELLATYDIAVCSTTIETGISIDLKGHFTAVFGFCNGLQSVSSAAQFLARLRDPVPRHLWIASSASQRFRIGSGSPSAKKLLWEKRKTTADLLTILSKFGLDTHDVDTEYFTTYLKTWADYAALINFQARRYRTHLLAKLIEEGHQVSLHSEDADPTLEGLTNLHAKVVRDVGYQDYCDVVTQAPNPPDERYQELRQQVYKTALENIEQHKGFLSRRYGEQQVTPDLVRLDNKGCYSKLRLHYYLTDGRKFLEARDIAVAERQFYEGLARIYLPDFNRSLYANKVIAYELLGVTEFLQCGQKLTHSTPQVLELAKRCKPYAEQLRLHLGITISATTKPLPLLKRFLSLVDLTLQRVGRIGSGKREWVYEVVRKFEGRDAVFEYWREQDFEQSINATSKNCQYRNCSFSSEMDDRDGLCRSKVQLGSQVIDRVSGTLARVVKVSKYFMEIRDEESGKIWRRSPLAIENYNN